MATNLLIIQRRSSAGASPPQRDALRSLGLRGIGSRTERSDGPALQGMLKRVAHLVTVEEKSQAGGKRSNG
jgi:large subunit ribosomal protein L30